MHAFIRKIDKPGTFQNNCIALAKELTAKADEL
jgi:hypothetical protein